MNYSFPASTKNTERIFRASESGECLHALLDEARYPNAYIDLIARKGREHEAAFSIAKTRSRAVAERGFAEIGDYSVAAEATAEAMRSGAKYIPHRLSRNSSSL